MATSAERAAAPHLMLHRWKKQQVSFKLAMSLVSTAAESPSVGSSSIWLKATKVFADSITGGTWSGSWDPGTWGQLTEWRMTTKKLINKTINQNPSTQVSSASSSSQLEMGDTWRYSLLRIKMQNPLQEVDEHHPISWTFSSGWSCSWKQS